MNEPTPLDGIDPDTYREYAIRHAARMQMRALGYVLECAGMCRNRLVSLDRNPYQPLAQSRLVERAFTQGWDIDAAGRLACPDCHRKMLESAARFRQKLEVAHAR